MKRLERSAIYLATPEFGSQHASIRNGVDMRGNAFFLVASVFAANPVFAASAQIKQGPVPGWVKASDLMPVPDGATGLLFVRRNDVLIHFDKQGREQYLGYRVRLLHQNALQLGNISVSWNPAAGSPLVHSIIVHRQNEAIDVLKSTSFEVLRRENQLEAAVLDGVLTATLRVPDLRVGDELEMAWSIRATDPNLGANDFGLLVLAAAPAQGRFGLGMTWDQGQEPNVKLTPDMAAAAKRSTNGLSFRFDNPPIAAPPKDAPPRYNWQRRIVEFSDFKDWSEISRYFAPMFAEAAKLDADSPLKKEAAIIAAAHFDGLARARAALTLVQQQVRYVYVGLDGGNLKPATAEETWQRRYGDCKGKTSLLLALLAELGVPAEPVLVNNTGLDDGNNERLPSPGMFDHVLVRATIGGVPYWLDGTLPTVAGPRKTPIIPYRWVLPLQAKGAPLEGLTWRPASRPNEVNLYEIDAREGFDVPAKITTTSIVRGVKGLEEQVLYSSVTQEQLLASLRQQLTGDTWQSIDEARWHYDTKAEASVLTIKGTGQVDWDDDEDGAKSLTLPGGGFNPPEKRVRPADQDQTIPYLNDGDFSCRVTTVRLPKSTLPAQWSFNSTFDTRLFGKNYYRMLDLRDGAIRMVRGLRVEKQEIDASSAARDNARIAGFDNSMAVISFDPTAKSRARPSEKVPATYDIDWTSDDVPCRATANSS